MTPRLSYRPQAEAEALAGRDWYEGRSPGLGTEFVRVLARTIDEIVDRPESFQQVRGEIRHAVLRRFPYSILFTYDGATVLILSIHHHRRDPRRWQGA
jgi:plasmid stabilization system protein ParE